MGGAATLVATICLLVLAAGPLTAGSQEDPESRQAQRERLIGVCLFAEHLEIEVASTGCTEPEDFVFVRERFGPSHMDVEVIRLHPDPCDGLEHTVTLRFRRESVGLEGIEVINFRNEFRGDPPPAQ